MIRKYYGRSILALLLIPAAAMMAGAIFELIDPELARGHANYARNFALLEHLRHWALLAALVLLGVLWVLACIWLLRAKSRRRIWTALGLLGPPGFAALSTLSDRSPPAPNDAYRRQLARLPLALRVLYEVLRFVAFAFLAMQLVEWFEYATALLDAARRSMSVAQVLAERDASSGMWAFGDSLRDAYVFVLLYAIWPFSCNAVAALARRLRRRGATTDA
jgi:hypothetical protein